MKEMICFASDNTAPAHPRVLRAVERANAGRAPSYGGDALTEQLDRRVRALFGPRARAYPVFNGTGANVTAIASFLKPHQAVIASDCSHLNEDECAALERFAGAKILPAPSRDGKITPEAVEKLLPAPGDVHRAQPRVLTISQTTEHGTVYRADEIRALSRLTRRRGMLLHVDGARFANALASLGLGLKAGCADLGVDALSFGGTKNGLLYGELVVLFGSPDGGDYPFARKQGLQLASKQRYIAAQFLAYLEDDLWLKNAARANAMAKRLARGLEGVVPVAYPAQANAVFPILSEPVAKRLQREFLFHAWDARAGLYRLMASYVTQTDEIDYFIERLKAALRTCAAARP